MHVLAIDIGSYSVKYVTSFVDRRKINHTDMSEIILRDFLEDHPSMSITEGQISIVQEIIDSNARPETKIIFQADSSLMTTRFLTMPVKSKKKAELMLPFQLEEDIPFALSEIHYAYRMEGQKSQYIALVELIKESNFEPFFTLLKDKNALPNILTTEASAVENYFNQNALAGPFCVMDVGHTTTKAYFFYNSRLLAAHVAYVGGTHINEMIAQTYGIDPDEAVIYKHQNAFFLTTGQYSEVEQAQGEFASAMDKVFSPLIADFARWKVGFKVNFGLSVPHVFLCGGSSNIKNITNYLTEKFDVKVALLESFDKIQGEKIDLNTKNKSKFSLVNMMAQGFRRKNRFINLLIGKFAQASTSELPLYSFSFIGVRVAAATAVLALALLGERFFIHRDIQFVNAKLTTVMKNDELGITGRLRRSATSNTKPIYDHLFKRQRSVRQEISTLQAAVETESLSPLVTLSQIAGATETSLIDFTSNDIGEVNATFTGDSVPELKRLKTLLEQSQLQEVTASLDETKLLLVLKAQGK